MSIVLAIAAFIWGAAACIVTVPRRSIPPAPSLLFEDDWPDDCAHLRGRAQSAMQRIFGVLAAAAALGSAVLAFQPHAGSSSPLLLTLAILIPLSTVVGTRQAAFLWERRAILHRAKWLRAAEAAKYHVTPIPSTPKV